VRECNVRQVQLHGTTIRVLLSKPGASSRSRGVPLRGRNRTRRSSQGGSRRRTRSRSRSYSKTDNDLDFEGKKIFVGRLPLSVKEKELKELFEPYGKIWKCYMPMRVGRGDVRHSRGVGFIIMKGQRMPKVL